MVCSSGWLGEKRGLANAWLSDTREERVSGWCREEEKLCGREVSGREGSWKKGEGRNRWVSLKRGFGKGGRGAERRAFCILIGH